MAKVIGYKGFIGINAVVENFAGGQLTKESLRDGLINDPFEDGQLGFVYKLENCSFNQEAIDLLKKVEKGSDDLGSIDLFSSDQVNAFCWLGGPMGLFDILNAEEPIGSNSYDASLLENIVPDFTEIPEDFMEYIDSLQESPDDAFAKFNEEGE